MSEKRRDSKNRILRTGESQRSDGRYVFKYNPAPGVSKFAYSWRLTPTDPVPPGKSGGPSLREKEQAIRRDLEDGINPLGESMTLCQLYERHNALHPNVREGTVESRALLMRILREDGIGLKPIGGIRPSDAKAWAIRMRDRGYAFTTIAGFKRSLTAAFYTARQDDLVRREPFKFKLSDVIENLTPPKLPLTPAQTRALLDFIEGDRVYGKYLDEIVFLLGTGLRISEFCGLTDSDIDFDAGTVRVERQLLKSHGVYRIAPPKTQSGSRVVPMSPPVMIAAANIIAKRRRPAYGSIDGHKGFLCITKNGTPMVADHWEDAFHGLVAKYAKSHPAEPLPDPCTLHTLRRTFCTSAALAGMNPKDLQYIMGHSNISLTLDYYTTATPESAASELSRIAPSLFPYYLPCYI